MPFYEYECASCKFYTEVMQRVSDAALKKCPSCGRSTLKKLISAPVFRLKGAGWYETDFKSDQENKRNLADREEKVEKEEKPQETKAEAKSETKSETAVPADAGKPPVKTRPAARTAARKSVRPVARRTKLPRRHK